MYATCLMLKAGREQSWAVTSDFLFPIPSSLSSPCTTDSRGGVEKEEGGLSTWRQSRQRVSLPLFNLYLWERSSEVRVRMTMPQQRTQSSTCTATPDPDTSGIPFPVGLKARTQGTCAWFLDAWWEWINVLVKTCLLITEQGGGFRLPCLHSVFHPFLRPLWTLILLRTLRPYASSWVLFPVWIPHH